MSTQEVPEWLNKELEQFFSRTNWGNESGRGVKWRDEYGDITEEVGQFTQTILSHMIDKQAVVDAIGEVESKHCKGSYEPQLCDGKCYIAAGRNQLRTEIRQALNLNGDESDGRRKD